MDATLSGMMIEIRLEQFWKALFPMDVTPSGIMMEVRLEQPEKEFCSMVVTPLGMVREVRLVHFMNAPLPIEIILSGSFRPVRRSQLRKA